MALACFCIFLKAVKIIPIYIFKNFNSNLMFNSLENKVNT